jgi:hypothetical protein
MVQRPLMCDHQLADDMKSVVAFDASANDSNVAVVVQGHETGIVQAKEDDRSIGGDSTETLLQIRDQFVHTVLGYLPPALCVFVGVYTQGCGGKGQVVGQRQHFRPSQFSQRNTSQT